MVVITPGEVHASGTRDGLGWLLESVYIPDAIFGRVAGEVVVPDRRDLRAALKVLAEPRTVGWFSMFWDVHTSCATSLERTSALNGLVSCLAGLAAGSPGAAASGGEEAPAVERARQFIHAYEAEEISLDELSAVAGLGPFRLNRAFRRIVGVPPHACQIQLRIRRAEALLADGLAIADAADRTGFFDQSHLGRHFKRLVGLSPGVYRRVARTS